MSKPVVIIGAGLAGLACARALHRQGIPIFLLEGSDRVGGRLKTDVVDGFKLDRGFQVYFETYFYGAQELDIEGLQLSKFAAGSYVFQGGKLHVIDQDRIWETLTSKLFGLKDKVLLKLWASEAVKWTRSQIGGMPDGTAEQYLRGRGFSSSFVDRFARPFFGGIFLDRSLQVSLRQLCFVFHELSRGRACVPSGGIECIPKQLAEGIPVDSIRVDSRVRAILRDALNKVEAVELESGEQVEAMAVIVATEAPEAARLTGVSVIEEFRSSTCLYFETPEPVVEGPYLVLNGEQEGMVNEVAPLSNAAAAYAPQGKHLISATVLGSHPLTEDQLVPAVQRELHAWFPKLPVDAFRFIKMYEIGYAQMAQPVGFMNQLSSHVTDTPGLFLAGEFTTNSSIDGAIQSGLECADAVLGKVLPCA